MSSGNLTTRLAERSGLSFRGLIYIEHGRRNSTPRRPPRSRTSPLSPTLRKIRQPSWTLALPRLPHATLPAGYHPSLLTQQTTGLDGQARGQFPQSAEAGARRH